MPGICWCPDKSKWRKKETERTGSPKCRKKEVRDQEAKEDSGYAQSDLYKRKTGGKMTSNKKVIRKDGRLCVDTCLTAFPAKTKGSAEDTSGATEESLE